MDPTTTTTTTNTTTTNTSRTKLCKNQNIQIPNPFNNKRIRQRDNSSSCINFHCATLPNNIQCRTSTDVDGIKAHTQPRDEARTQSRRNTTTNNPHNDASSTIAPSLVTFSTITSLLHSHDNHDRSM